MPIFTPSQASAQMKNRKISHLILKRHAAKTGRIIVFTGARQTGKTTLARKLFHSYEYISIEDPILRGQYSRLTAQQWKNAYPLAILDEIQKEPGLIESIKSVYDQWADPKYILLGSSQLLLLEKVKESLAGRCAIFELFPLTLPEIKTQGWESPVEESFFQSIIREQSVAIDPIPSALIDKEVANKQQAWQHYLKFGGYPAVVDPELDEDERYDWLQNYVRTYLERDIRDLASFRDLDPFIKLQHYLALNTGNLINLTAIATQLGVTSKTVQRYIRYFELSYQAVLLPAWARNKNKRLVKTPKVHYLDNGIVQAVLQKRGGLTGNEFESLVIAEMYKQIKNIFAQATFYHFRTQDGREVDLLIEVSDGYYAFEIKLADKIRRQDIRHLKNLEQFLDKPLLHAFLLSNDNETQLFDSNITALNAAWFLG
ncbi:MAG: ATP-binding protein [Bacteroidota bacterium]|nr:ATP-binding protein [Bacteroidota bacterium]